MNKITPIRKNVTREPIVKGQKRADGWQNLLTTIGTNLDKRSGAQLHWEHRDPGFYEEMYAGGGIPARIVDLVPEEALRHWIEWTNTSKDEQEEINDRCEELDVRGALLKSWKWGRGYGGGVCHIVTDTSDPASPLRVGERVIGLRDLSRWDLRILTTDVEYDFGSPNWGHPRIYYLNVQMGSQYKGYPIHWTRMVRFDGQLVPRRTYIRNNYWHDSILNRLYNSIRNYEISNDAAAACLQDFNVDVFGMKNLANLIAAGNEDIVAKRMEMMQLSKSVINGMLIDSDEETYENKGRTMQGFAELLVHQANRLVAETDIPHTKLLGESPDGSNATGNSTSQQWYNYIASEQENYLRPKLKRLLQAIFPDRPDLGFKFKSLRVLDDLEKADLKLKTAQTDQIYFEVGALDPTEITNSRFGGEEWSPETTIDKEARDAGLIVPHAQEEGEGGDGGQEEEPDEGDKPPEGKPSRKTEPGASKPSKDTRDADEDSAGDAGPKEEDDKKAAKDSVEGRGIGEPGGGVSEFEPRNTQIRGGSKPIEASFISQTMSEPMRDPRTDPPMKAPGTPNKHRTILPTRGNGLLAGSGYDFEKDPKLGSVAREGARADSADVRKAATVIVRRGDKFLMGKTNKDGRWTLPGGHIEGNESRHAGAVRELAEETGLQAKRLKFLGSRLVEPQQGQSIEVHMYEHNADDEAKITSKLDPDKEVSKWEWFSSKEPLSDEVQSNLKHPNNVGLQHLGVLK